jgi:hypothetical protein
MDRHPEKKTVSVQLTSSATNVQTTTSTRAPFNAVVERFTYVPNADVTGASNNYRKLRLINRGRSGGGTTVIGEFVASLGSNLTAFDERTVDLSSTPSNLAVDEGDVIEMRSEPIGSGLAGPGGTGHVLFTRV